MNGREYFHESVVKDIVDILTDLKDFDEVQFINNANARRSFKSITHATKDLILTFPVMVSTDIEPDNAIMISKAQEKKMASLLHILFTAISVGNNEDVYDYVRKFHSNVGNMGGTLDNYADALDKLATTFDESYNQTLKIDHAVLETVLEELKESNYVLPDDIKETSLESFKVVPGIGGRNDMIIHEGKNNNRYSDPNKYLDYIMRTNNWAGRQGVDLSAYQDMESLNAKLDTLSLDDTVKESIRGAWVDFHNYDDVVANTNKVYQNLPSGNNSYKLTQTTTSTFNNRTSDSRTDIVDRMKDIETKLLDTSLSDAEKDKLNKEHEVLEKNLGRLDQEREKAIQAQKDLMNIRQRDNRPELQRKVDMAKYMADMTKAHNAIVLNNEYKKANELQPTMMVVNFMRKDSEGRGTIQSAVIGIKCKIYPINSADIVNRISGKLQDKSFLTNFVRATTNEIAFFRDFLFAVDNAKIDAKSYGKSASSNKLWKVLERRSTKSKFRRSLKMYNDATAISTLVMSENDNEYLKKMYSIDMLNVARARKIMDSFNFMCIVIANQSTEVASFLYDTGDDTYEMIPFSGLEREASDNSYKKMVNLMAKVSR